MGWTSYPARYYRNCTVDRKAECDHEVNCANERYSWEVVQSRMVGSTYYAAVRRTDIKTGHNVTYATVFLTRIHKTNTGHDFFYKSMDESMMPYYFDCPKLILDLLTDTDNEDSLEWRRRCKERREQTRKLRSDGPIRVMFPFEIRYNDGHTVLASGTEIELEKRLLPYRKQKCWCIKGTHSVVAKKLLNTAIML